MNQQDPTDEDWNEYGRALHDSKVAEMELHEIAIKSKLNKMQKAESKITAITPNGTYDNQHGTLYKFEYAFEDGTVITANHKKDSSPFNVDDVAEYEIKGSNDYGSWGAVRKPGFVQNGQRQSDPAFQKGIEVGHAINNGTHLAIAALGSTVTIDDVERYANDVLDLAAKMKSE